jgi:hypothetical protein
VHSSFCKAYFCAACSLKARIVELNMEGSFFQRTGANPTTESYDAIVVNIYNTMSSLVRFENKNSLF